VIIIKYETNIIEIAAFIISNNYEHKGLDTMDGQKKNQNNVFRPKNQCIRMRVI